MGDHRRVVSAVAERDEQDLRASTFAPGDHFPPQQAVRRHATRDREPLHRPLVAEPVQAIDQLRHRGVPEAGEEVEHLPRPGLVVACGVGQRPRRSAVPGLDLAESPQRLTLQSRVRERQFAGLDRGHPERTGRRITELGQAIDLGAGREGQADTMADLVEGLADRVVPGLGQAGHGARRTVDGKQAGVAARNDQADHRLGYGPARAVGPEQGREEVALQVVHGKEGHAERVADRLAEREPDEKRPNQAGPAGRRDGADVGPVHARFLKRRGRHPGPVAEMFPRRRLRHHAAERTVDVELAGDHGRKHPALGVEHRAGGVVAGRLDAEDETLERGGRSVGRGHAGDVILPLTGAGWHGGPPRSRP